MNDYQEILTNYTVDDGNCPFVFTLLEDEKKYYLEGKNVVNFYKFYCDSYSNKNINHNVLEKINEKSFPLHSVFTFQFKDENSYYNKHFITELIKIHQKIIKDFFFVSSNNLELICVFSETQKVKNGKKITIKICLQFPYCKLEKSFYQDYVKPELLKKLKNIKLNDFLYGNYIRKSWDIILEDLQENRQLLGSKKEEFIYDLKYVYGNKSKEISLTNNFDYENHSAFENIDNYEDIEEMINDISDYEERNKYLLPIFLSFNFWNENCKPKIEIEPLCEESDEEEEDILQKEYNPTSLEIIMDLIDYLNDERFEKNIYFDDIGKALFSATKDIEEDGEKKGLEIWKELSNRGDYPEHYCDDKYQDFENSGVTEKTIAWYARLDNKKKYEEWHNKWCVSKIKYCITNHEHVSVAEAFYRIFWLDYMATDKIWFRFIKSSLRQMNDDIHIRTCITEQFIPRIDKFQSQLNIEVSKQRTVKSTTAKQKTDALDDMLNMARKLISSLKTDSYRRSLVKTVKEYFYRENLLNLLNKNENLLGTSNCVVHLAENKAYIRPGKPEDFITKMIGVSYGYEYNYNHPDIKDILLYFRQVFPNPDICEFMKKDLASYLRGKNAEKKFRVWIGDTNGSKSIYQQIIKKMFGQYYCDVPAEFYSSKQRGGGPNPEIAQLENSRVGFSAEPDDDTSFKGARVKRMTGGDSFYARGCGKDGGSIEATFKLIMILNIVPHIEGMDHATQKRFAMIPFESTWYDIWEKKLPESMEEKIKMKSFYKDHHIEKKIPRLARALLWLAVEYYSKYLEEGLESPPYIQKWMSDYWKTHDPYIEFMSEKLEIIKVEMDCNICNSYNCKDEGYTCEKCDGLGKIKVRDRNFHTTATKVYGEFKKWMKENHPDINLISTSKLGDMFDSKEKLGKRENKRWYGVKILSDEE